MSKENILAYVRKTNPGMTEERLFEEMKKSRYSAIGLILTAQNFDKEKTAD